MLLSHLARDACNADFANHGWSTCEVRTAQKADGLPLTTATSRRQRLTCQAIRSQMCLLHGSAAFSLVQHGSAVQSLIFLMAICFFGDKSALALVEDSCPSQQQEFEHLAHLVLTDSEDFCAECFARHG